ncbi:MAG: dehydrogenase/reductase oxidoreductase protein-like protein [Polaromonas sp.]|nr:dehydrogenase/reductase oxidoreductase protein-like protein [Polaromonas sp.]
MPPPRSLAIVTGASSGIGYNLAVCCAQNGFDLLVAADQPLDEAAGDFRALGAQVDCVQAELAGREGVDQLCAAIRGRPVEALLANAGHGLGRSFLEQEFNDIQHVIDTNITGTLYLIRQVAPGMVSRRRGRILVTGSIAGFMPGAFQAVYNGSKAFVDSFAAALRNELKSTGVTVTCLMPGPTDTDFFMRADMLDTQVGTDESAMSDPADVARAGFSAMMRGEADVVAGFKNKLQVAMAKVMPSDAMAEMHRKLAQPGTAEGAQGSNQE